MLFFFLINIKNSQFRARFEVAVLLAYFSVDLFFRLKFPRSAATIKYRFRFNQASVLQTGGSAHRVGLNRLQMKIGEHKRVPYQNLSIDTGTQKLLGHAVRENNISGSIVAQCNRAKTIGSLAAISLLTFISWHRSCVKRWVAVYSLCLRGLLCCATRRSFHTAFRLSFIV